MMRLRLFLFASALILVGCGGGTSNSNSTPPPIQDSTPPILNFDPASLTLESEESGDVVLTATDNVGVTSGPDVTCTNGGVFENNVFTAPTISEETQSVCTATARDASGNQGTATLTVTVTVKDPMAVAKINTPVIMEGGPFKLSAVDSTDAENDPLTYLWTQTSGTPVVIADNTLAELDLKAEFIRFGQEDETLEFELEVSDGLDTDTDTVSILVENIQTKRVVSDASRYSASTLNCLTGLIAEDNGNFTAFWGHGFSLDENPSAYIEYDPAVNPITEQVDALFQIGMGNSEYTHEIIKSGDTLYYVNERSVTNAGNSEQELFVHIGYANGEIETPASFFSSKEKFQFDIAPLEDDKIVVVVAHDPERRHDRRYDTLQGYIIDRNGGVFPFSPNPDTSLLKHTPSVASIGNDTLLVTWSETQGDVFSTRVFAQFAKTDGTLIGSKFSISEGTSMYGEIYAKPALLPNGNILIVWDSFGVFGRVISSQGAYVTKPIFIGNSVGPPLPVVLPTGEIFIISFFTEDVRGNRFVTGDLVSSDLTPIMFVNLASEPAALEARDIKSTVLPDGRVIIGWRNASDDNCETANPLSESYLMGLYPVGKLTTE